MWALAARASAASPQRTRPSISRLPGRSGWISGASSASAASGEARAGSAGPADGEVGEILVGILERDERDRLALEAGLGDGQRRLVGIARDDAEPVAASDVGGGQHGDDVWTGGGPRPEVAEGEGGVREGRADGAQGQGARRGCVGAEKLGAVDLGAAVEPGEPGADGGAGGRQRDDGRGGVAHGSDDPAVAGAPAEHAAEGVGDLRLRGVRGAIEKG